MIQYKNILLCLDVICFSYIICEILSQSQKPKEMLDIDIHW